MFSQGHPPDDRSCSSTGNGPSVGERPGCVSDSGHYDCGCHVRHRDEVVTVLDGFAGKVAFVSGAASGIGRAVALELASGGASVALADLNADGVEQIAKQITSGGGRALALPLDVADLDRFQDATDRTVDELGGLHLAVNNAGIAGPGGRLAELDVKEYLELIDVNLHSVFYAMHTQIPHLLDGGGGAIVNVSSVLGLVSRAGATAYSTAKHGVAGMTKAAALDYAQEGIRVNCVNPGYIDTPLIMRADQDRRKGLIAKHPVGRLGLAGEVAQVVLFLLSDRSSFVTGSQYVVDGGYTVQ